MVTSYDQKPKKLTSIKVTSIKFRAYCTLLYGCFPPEALVKTLVKNLIENNKNAVSRPLPPSYVFFFFFFFVFLAFFFLSLSHLLSTTPLNNLGLLQALTSSYVCFALLLLMLHTLLLHKTLRIHSTTPAKTSKATSNYIPKTFETNPKITTVLYGKTIRIFGQIVGIRNFIRQIFGEFLEDFGGTFWRFLG